MAKNRLIWKAKAESLITIPLSTLLFFGVADEAQAVRIAVSVHSWTRVSLDELPRRTHYLDYWRGVLHSVFLSPP
jgi:hypothetical protein